VESIIACKTCGLLQRVEALKPALRRVFPLRGLSSSSTRPTALDARQRSLWPRCFFLYRPHLSILLMDFYGAYSESTVWDGCVTLYQDGQWPVATIVFLASIVSAPQTPRLFFRSL